MLVRELMSTEVPRVPASGSLQDAASRLFAADVRYCLVVDDDDVPSALLTGRRMLNACYKTRKSLDEIPVSAIATTFGPTVSPDRTVVYAAGLMSKHDVDYLPVLDGLTFHGVLTQRAIATNLDKFRKESIDNAMTRWKWEQ